MGRRTIDHRVAEPHECDECVRHQCSPLAPTTIRHIHFTLSGAFKRAVRWRWLSVNPMAQAEPPPAPKPNPQPPTATQAARIVNESWRDPDRGALVWTAMTTGVRRGEMCAVRVSSVDLDEGRETIFNQAVDHAEVLVGVMTQHDHAPCRGGRSAWTPAPVPHAPARRGRVSTTDEPKNGHNHPRRT